MQITRSLSRNWRSRAATLAAASVAISVACLKDPPAAPTQTCAFPSSSVTVPVGAEGATINVPVTPALTTCSWTAQSFADFITVLEGASGSGPGTVRARVDANTAATRSGTLVAGGLTTTVLQSGPITTVIDATDGITGTDDLIGQSFTIPGTGAVNFTRFSFFNSLRRPIAPGILYLFSREYAGTPQDLSTTSPGFLARSQASVDGEYLFAPDVTLAAGTRYWVYLPDRLQLVGSLTTSVYEAGDAYVAVSGQQIFRRAGSADWNFRLRGSR